MSTSSKQWAVRVRPPGDGASITQGESVHTPEPSGNSRPPGGESVHTPEPSGNSRPPGIILTPLPWSSSSSTRPSTHTQSLPTLQKKIEPGDTEIGKRDTYTYVSELGEGAFGAVWLARQQSDGKEVAIKIYHIEDDAADYVDTIQAELDGLAVVSSKYEVCGKYSICLRDAYRVDDEYRMVMDYVNGKSLTDMIRETPLAERVKNTDVAKTLARGMDALHRLGITHQDIKEDNIMWDTAQGYPKYVDWGLACIEQLACAPNGGLCNYSCGWSGTPYTMPPDKPKEVITPDGKKTYEEVSFDRTKAHDIWSLGVVLLNWYTSISVYDIYSVEYAYYRNTAIKKIEDHETKKLIELMLADTWKQRLDNWREVMEMVGPDSKAPHPLPKLAIEPLRLLPEMPAKRVITKARLRVALVIAIVIIIAGLAVSIPLGITGNKTAAIAVGVGMGVVGAALGGGALLMQARAKSKRA